MTHPPFLRRLSSSFAKLSDGLAMQLGPLIYLQKFMVHVGAQSSLHSPQHSSIAWSNLNAMESSYWRPRTRARPRPRRMVRLAATYPTVLSVPWMHSSLSNENSRCVDISRDSAHAFWHIWSLRSFSSIYGGRFGIGIAAIFLMALTLLMIGFPESLVLRFALQGQGERARDREMLLIFRSFVSGHDINLACSCHRAWYHVSSSLQSHNIKLNASVDEATCIIGTSMCSMYMGIGHGCCG